jgi:hypothetical protein
MVGIELVSPEAVCTVRAPDDGRRNHLKHVEHFSEIKIKKRRILLVAFWEYIEDAQTY